MPDVKKRRIQAILGRSLLAGESLASEFRQRLVAALVREQAAMTTAELVELARRLLDDFAPIYARAITDSDLAAWVDGMTSVLDKTPISVRRVLEGVPAGEPIPSRAAAAAAAGITPGPPGSILTASAPGVPNEPFIRFPMIERAADLLEARRIVTRAEFDTLAAEARTRAFTIAREAREDVIERVRDTLTETIREGASLRKFREKLGEELQASFIGPGHLENVYRTNIQAAFHQGLDEMASNPIVDEYFVYQEYLPIRDGRVRKEHLALEKLGLSGTGVYRRDDPFWSHFTPPWDYQ